MYKMFCHFENCNVFTFISQPLTNKREHLNSLSVKNSCEHHKIIEYLKLNDVLYTRISIINQPKESNSMLSRKGTKSPKEIIEMNE